MRDDEIKKFIIDVVTASVFVAPRDVGLTRDELTTLAKDAGYLPGEIKDGINEVCKHYPYARGRVLPIRPGLGYSDFNATWGENDPRDPDVFNNVRCEMQLFAREEGVTAWIDRSLFADKCVALGMSPHDAEVAISCIILDEIFEEEKGRVRYRPGKHKYILPHEQIATRSPFTWPSRIGDLLPFVRDIIARRSDLATPSKATVTSPALLTASERNKAMTANDPSDPKKVFIIHGRNDAARQQMVYFLRALSLDPINFQDLRSTMGGTPTISDVVFEGMRQARGVVAIFTPEEYAALRPDHREPHDSGEFIERWQARPNVIFEAGMAFGIDPKRVVFVTMGNVKLFSDVAGIHAPRQTNKPESRQALAHTLKSMGCAVNTSSSDWYTHGNFEDPVAAPLPQHRDPFGT
jgi:predicted nucleotide-binding protein